ncbi:tRNA lysidine(34) synthetase TilS [Spirosoma utsteinense]|uniref:tRNA(Ile)-lysidine synthase n=1 Tax=Spirosoma utsteinense TaxID=2585773 RepID=A0ABR6VZN1_9BACT|nr:tRNA lysidine(34) synthetase TilS [Spirosoma utsteinense]MBC3784492.1 tRNA(Ile)-lysidine synthase [Spirosoma utsteinense]MBC3789758.1 tRNA(Ile)-lysidine synthase [Spirosoma utsteinense]
MLERDFLGFINEKRLFGCADCILLAVSGGLDSVVMADLFQRTGLRFAIAHFNFGLREDESDGDAVFVQNMAIDYGVPFHLTRFETKAIAAERGISIQMAARDLRYDWFRQLIRAHGYNGVATAHHQNDVLETLLLNLTRGTGLAGLHGISARQDDIIRPLLFATRQELEAYVAIRNLSYREDRSNADDKYARNRIRHHVTPILHELNPGLWHTLPRTVERLRAAEALVRDELDRSWQVVATPVMNGFFLPADKLLAQPELAFRLTEWLKPYGFTEGQTLQMIESLHRQTGQTFLSAGINEAVTRITHDRLNKMTGLLLEPFRAHTPYEIDVASWSGVPINVAGYFTLTFGVEAKPAGFTPATDPNSACLDADQVVFPVTIRPWQLGDRFRPLGMAGTKLVSDLLNDLKLSRHEREQTAVVLSQGQIVWVIGRRIDHQYRVTTRTKNVLTIVRSDL